jgi:hypothetical protein
MRPFGTRVILVCLLAGGLMGCDQGPPIIPIPPGAQVVHVVITESEVRLDPATVRAGDVYLVLDEPLVGSFLWVQRKRAADEAEGPLSNDDLERISHGDSEGTSMGGLDSGGCAADQDAASRGKMGPCGNVLMATVAAGKYAVLGPGWTEQETEPSVDPTADPAGFVPPPFMGVLTVIP